MGGVVAPLLAGVAVVGGCASDPAKDARPTGPSFGSQIYTVLCERVGAQSLREDLTGGSYEGICQGTADKVDTTLLPPPPDAKVRQLGIAKVEAIGRHRVDLVAALETVFPDDSIVAKNLSSPDPKASCDPVSGQSRKEQLRQLLSRLLPTKTNDTVPESSRSLAESIQPLTEAQGAAARSAIAHVAARRGYMPADTATGLLGALFTAPRLRETLAATTHLLSKDATPYEQPNTVGSGHDTLLKFFTALKADLAEPTTDEAPLGTLYDQATGQTLLSRPRTTLELAREAMLTQNPVFSDGGPPLWVVKRDRRGMASVTKTDDGKVKPPFVDANNDGLPDLDKLGRFVLAPNASPPPDPFVGNDQSLAYEFVNARETAASALLRHVAALANPETGHEALFSSVQALEPLVRPGPGREAFLDMVHAGGQIAANPGADDLLALVKQLFVKQPQLMARLTGNLLDAKATFDAHPEAKLPDGSTMIDDLLAVLVKIGKEPGLLEEVLASLADDKALAIAQALPAYMKFNDRMTYDRAALNGPPKSIGTGRSEPSQLVDRTSANSGWNRSIFQRILQLIHDTNGVTLCNKDQALLHGVAQLGRDDNGNPIGPWTPVLLPLTGPAQECQVFRVENLASFYLDAVAGQAKLHFRDITIASNLSPEALTRSLNINWTGHSKLSDDIEPEPPLLNRLVFFDVANDSKNGPPPLNPDGTVAWLNPDGTVVWPPFAKGFAPPNGQTNLVISELQGPAPTTACAERTIDDPYFGDPDAHDVHPDGKIHGLRTCGPGQTLAERDGDTLFALETFNGYDALKPLTSVFVKHHKEDLLIELLDTLYKHWNVEGGVANAEPALAEILSGDMVPALNALTKVVLQSKITRCAQSDCSTTADVPAGIVLAEGIRSLTDPDRAAGVTDRHGSMKTAKGGSITLLNLLRDSLNAEDSALDLAGTTDRWHDARSRIVDELVAVNGRGDKAQFADPGVPAMIPVLIDLLRSQRDAKCLASADCPALRKDLAVEVENSLSKDIVGASLDLLDTLLKDQTTRRELGRMLTYLTSKGDALGGASVDPSATPFAQTTARAPGALDQTIAATVDALGALGDLKEIRPFYPVITGALDHVDPELVLLSQLSARAYDPGGHEICSRELDPDEAIQALLSRVTIVVQVPGQPKRSALQIFLDAMSDVNRLDASASTPLDADDYGNVFKNVHELLTDPTGGLEQLYASVKAAAEH